MAQAEDNIRPPFITTPLNVVDAMLALAGTGPADTVADLGSGDGRIVIAAASKFGARGFGLELDATLVAASRDNARAAGVADRVEFRVADILKTDFSSASVITAYLLPWLLARLGNALLYDLKPGTRIVTHAFILSGWQPDRTEKVIAAAPDPKAGAETTIFMWTVPAQARGEWRAASPGGEWRLRIQQNFQELDIEGSAGTDKLAVAPVQMEGARIAFSGTLGSRGERFAFSGRVEGGRIRGEAALEGGGARRVVPLVFVK